MIGDFIPPYKNTPRLVHTISQVMHSIDSVIKSINEYPTSQNTELTTFYARLGFLTSLVFDGITYRYKDSNCGCFEQPRSFVDKNKSIVIKSAIKPINLKFVYK